jgi:4-amino-4-deoxy-L-arabinose transferase-like glycosyltransferase
MRAFRLLTIAAFAAAIVPRLAHRGMFVDGVTYASIARNLAEGRGSFWAPSYTATIYPTFHDHPPLGLWLQSLWFRVLGDHLFVERAYSLTAAVATAALIAAIWRDLERKGVVPVFLGWWPILLWIAVPVVSWAIVGNLLETTVALFTTAATLAALHGVVATRSVRAIGWGALSGAFVVAAGLTKGPVGLFPLVAPLTFVLLPYACRVPLTLFAQWIAVAAAGGALLAFPMSRASLNEYVNVQVLAAVSGQREVSAGSLTILKDLVQQVMLPMAGMAILAVAAARRFEAPSSDSRKYATAFTMLGLAATLPILASAKQAGHYLVPAVPLYVLAAAVALAPTWAVFGDGFGRGAARWVSLASVLILAVAAGAAFLPGRDEARLANLDTLAASVPRGATIGICPAVNDDWGLHAWFERRFGVSLDADGGQGRSWFLKTTSRAADACRPPQCPPVTDPTRDLVLLKCGRSE